jgi:hypothetical protein
MNQIKNQISTLNFNQKHIEAILNNYHIKYNKFKNQIDIKLNELIKEFLSDFLLFLGYFQGDNLLNIKTKEIEFNKNEIECLLKKLKNKEKNEYNLKQEIKYLLNENHSLKNKIKNQKKKMINLNTYDEKKEKYSFNNNFEKNNISISNKKNQRTHSDLNKVHNQSFNGINNKKPKEQKINNFKSIVSKTENILNGFQLFDNISNMIKKKDKQNFSNFHSDLLFNKINMYKYLTDSKKQKEKRRNRSEEKNIRKLIDDYNEILNEEILVLENEETDLLQLLNKNPEQKN